MMRSTFAGMSTVAALALALALGAGCVATSEPAGEVVVDDEVEAEGDGPVQSVPVGPEVPVGAVIAPAL